MVKSITEISKETGLARYQILLLVHSNDSPWFQIGSKWFVDVDEFKKQLKNREQRNKNKIVELVRRPEAATNEG